MGYIADLVGESKDKDNDKDKTPPTLPADATKLVTRIVKAVTRKAPDADVRVMAADDEGDVTDWIPTGFPNVDAVLGGGWPLRRCSELYGVEASGKSALADMAIVQVQRMGGLAVVYEFENTRDKRRLQAMGVDLSRLLSHRPKHLEEAFANVWLVHQQVVEDNAAARKRGVKPTPVLFILDSIGAAPTRDEVDTAEADAKGVKDGRPGTTASVLSRNCKLLFHRIREVNAHFMFINQVRESFGQSFFKTYETPGGKAVKFASTLRVRCTAQKYPRTRPHTGLWCRVFTDKNKIVPPYREARWMLDFEAGPSPELTLLELGVVGGAILRRGGKYVVPVRGKGDVVVPDRAAWIALCARRPALVASLWRRVAGAGVASPATTGDDPEPEQTPN